MLGTQLQESGQVAQTGPEPGPETVFVDPADLFYIREMGPNAPGGAASANYRWLGIKGEASFPEPVRDAVQAALDAKFHDYGQGKLCIHSIGPDFRGRQLSRGEALAELAQAYRAVLAEFVTSGRPHLRLLPISGGIFIGDFAGELPELTAEAFDVGFSLLDAGQQSQVLSARLLEMCIFLEAELPAFTQSFAARR